MLKYNPIYIIFHVQMFTSIHMILMKHGNCRLLIYEYYAATHINDNMLIDKNTRSYCVDTQLGDQISNGSIRRKKCSIKIIAKQFDLAVRQDKYEFYHKCFIAAHVYFPISIKTS